MRSSPSAPLFDPAAPPTSVVPGLIAVAALTAVATALHAAASTISALLIGVLLGALVGNAGLVRPPLQPGFRFAARRILRVGIVLLGLRLSLTDVADLGLVTIIVVVTTVVATFFGTQLLGTRLGLSPDLSLLIATGYSICGASAIVAVEGSTDATEDEVAVSIGLVTLCGTLAIIIIPPLGDLLGLTDRQLGTWIGAGIHDVGQVAAAGSIAGASVLAVAVVVKLTRVSLLAAVVTWVNLARRSGTGDDAEADAPAQPILPLFIVGFLTMVAVRSTDLLGDTIIDATREIEGILLTAALVGLGAGVQAQRIRALGPAPLLVGLLAWLLVGGVSLAATAALI
ncbi:MAG: putative sulfate exporter family transporter [Actinomycetota bacterium]